MIHLIEFVQSMALPLTVICRSSFHNVCPAFMPVGSGVNVNCGHSIFELVGGYVDNQPLADQPRVGFVAVVFVGQATDVAEVAKFLVLQCGSQYKACIAACPTREHDQPYRQLLGL